MSSPRVRLSADKRRKQILRHAVRVFARSNYRAARVADIAAAAGISEAMIYKHFSSKKAIFLEILEHMSSRILSFWQEEIDAEPDALTCLRNMATTYYARMTKHPNELKVQFQAVSETNDQEIARRLHQDHVAYMAMIRGVIERGVEQGTIRKDVDVDILVWLWNGGGIIMNMMRLLSFKREFDEATVARLVEFIIKSMRS